MRSSDGGGSPGASGGPGGPRDRRTTHRAAIEIPAILHMGGRRVDCSLRDLSTRGIALAMRESLAPGMVVRVAFRLPNARQPVEVAGVLVRQAGGRDDGTVGLEFVEPDADTMRIIETFVDRNRSDRPFSHRRLDGPDTERVEVSEDAARLRGLYRKAVDDVAEKPKRRGLLARWRQRWR